MVLVGRIARVHGLKGHVVVNPETDFVDERFAPGSRLWTVRGGVVEPLTVESSRVQNGRPVVRFAGIERIEEAEHLAACELRIPERALQPLGAGQYYEHQLAGCLVETAAGERVGVVTAVDGGGGLARLVVQGARGEVLIPFVEAICTEVDVEGRRIRIEPPEGLLELNT